MLFFSIQQTRSARFSRGRGEGHGVSSVGVRGLEPPGLQGRPLHLVPLGAEHGTVAPALALAKEIEFLVITRYHQSIVRPS